MMIILLNFSKWMLQSFKPKEGRTLRYVCLEQSHMIILENGPKCRGESHCLCWRNVQIEFLIWNDCIFSCLGFWQLPHSLTFLSPNSCKLHDYQAFSHTLLRYLQNSTIILNCLLCYGMTHVCWINFLFFPTLLVISWFSFPRVRGLCSVLYPPVLD